jgi:hypothetical protein
MNCISKDPMWEILNVALIDSIRGVCDLLTQWILGGQNSPLLPSHHFRLVTSKALETEGK